MRKLAIFVALCLLAAAAYLTQGAGNSAAPALDGPTTALAQHEGPTTARATATAKQAVPANPRKPAASEPQSDQLAQQQREVGRREPLQRFQREMLAGLDGCLQQRPEARSAQRMDLRFERETAADGQHHRFKLAEIIPIGVAPGQSPQASPNWHCFAALIGRPLDVPAGSFPQEPSFREAVIVPLPNSVGWSVPHRI